ncbi:MAG: STAS domain-containing protein [Candidatus Accumulibacter sp.]|nr:STAS domain-containing protein [Accumulibacter sp.]
MITRPAVVVRPAAGEKKTRHEDDRAEKARQPGAELAGGDGDLQGFSDGAMSDLSDQYLGMTQSSLDFKVDTDFDPVNAPAEEAAVLFANNQDQAAQMILKNSLKSQRSGPAERLWLMLFDLYRLSGQRPDFEALGIDYARAFEKSPPIWGLESGAPDSGKASKRGRVAFKGDLLGGNAASFEAVWGALEKNRALRLDLSKVGQVDAEGCEALRKLLLHARRDGCGIELLGQDVLVPLVRSGVEAGKKETPAAGKEYWLLLLELLQRRGQQDVFEDLAIDYAVAFEESPPSWEAGQVAAPEPAAQEAEEAAEGDATDDGAYVLSGEIHSSRFDDMPAFAQERDSLLIDCARLTRIDFVSAGALLNALTVARSAGKQIVFRHPNHLVAELFRVVGLTAVASFVFAKY